MSSLAERQAELVATLVGGGPLPDGFDPAALDATRHALLHKRAGEVAWRWPELVRSYGRDWTHAFASWAAGRPPQGGWRDGWDFARDTLANSPHRADPDGERIAQRQPAAGPPTAAAVELAIAEVRWRYNGRGAPTTRRLPSVRRAGRAWVLQVGGRIFVAGDR